MKSAIFFLTALHEVTGEATKHNCQYDGLCHTCNRAGDFVQEGILMQSKPLSDKCSLLYLKSSSCKISLSLFVISADVSRA